MQTRITEKQYRDLSQEEKEKYVESLIDEEIERLQSLYQDGDPMKFMIAQPHMRTMIWYSLAYSPRGLNNFKEEE